MTRIVAGSKGGSSSTATEASDTLSSTANAQILDLISEGPCYGPANGTIGASTYLNDTPLQNADGSYNFNVASEDYRVGTIDQDYISGFDTSASEVTVGVELKAVTPWVHTVTNLALDALRVTLSVNALSQQDQKSGDINGYRVAYQVQLSVDDGAFSAVIDTAFDGKASSTYTRSHRIDLKGAVSHYTIRVVRTTADATTSFIQDTTNIVSYAELVDAKLRYPMSALVAFAVDATEFSTVPTRSYDWKGLLIKYPSNYDPDTRTYAGTWDGTFITGWTDNPAWIFYDLVLNSVYGLGRWIDASMVDRYSLYSIAQYCDVFVSDGAGGTEPRFRCNCYIQTRADAYKVLQDLASVFRGMAYWANSSVTATADMPFDPAYIYTQANVVDGKFKYVGSSLKTRYTVALVTWNDPDNAYQQAVEYVEDADGVARYGINKAETIAFGCTSRSQAQRVGQWTLITSRYETNTVTFSTGLDGTVAMPGQIIEIADAGRAGRRMAGRIRSVTSITQITVDRAMPEATVGDTLTLMLPSGKAETQTIQAIDGQTFTTVSPYSVLPVSGAVWLVESATVQSQLFRVSSVKDQGGITFEITATQHEPSKYAVVDDGAAFDLRPVSDSTVNVQAAPTGITVSQYVIVDQGIAKTNMTIAWQAPKNAVAYTVQWRRGSGDWVTAGTTGGTSIDVQGIYTGQYLARVRAVNGIGIASPYGYSVLTTLAGKTGEPPSVAALTATTDQVLAIDIGWSFPSGADDTAYTELYYSKTSGFDSASQLGMYSYPTNSAQLLNLASGSRLFFWARLVDTSGNVGPWYPDGVGVQGQSTADGTVIASYLAGLIGQTQLSQDLQATIGDVPNIKQSVSDAQEALAAEVQARGVAISSEQSSRQDADSALSERIDSVGAAVNANNALITSEQSARVDGDTALGQRIDAVSASVVIPEMAGSMDDYAGAEEVYAGVYSEQSARAEADLALGTRIDGVSASVTQNNATLQAQITSESDARATGDSAQAQQITTVQAQVADNSAAVQTVSTSYADLNGALSASYTIKTQVTSGGLTYVAGIGVGIDNSTGVIQSQVLVSADRFAVINSTTGTGITAPFIVQNGQVVLATAMIGNGYITNAMIGAYIQSDNYVAGSTGWQISKAGVFEMNASDGGGGRLVINGASIRTLDPNNVARVTLGRIS
ncbi:host specificity protein J [Robbsia andropogonis]|uniref:host specificity protein J n=1 Tax=Robbsia andropogonis TaxID=28092 RepID=UPI002A6A0585|nr:phage tail protein [Robbsia andropogonis]